MKTLKLKEITFNVKIEEDVFNKSHAQTSYGSNRIISKELFEGYKFIEVSTTPKVANYATCTVITTYKINKHDDLTNSLELIQEEIVGQKWVKKPE